MGKSKGKHGTGTSAPERDRFYRCDRPIPNASFSWRGWALVVVASEAATLVPGRGSRRRKLKLNPSGSGQGDTPPANLDNGMSTTPSKREEIVEHPPLPIERSAVHHGSYPPQGGRGN